MRGIWAIGVFFAATFWQVEGSPDANFFAASDGLRMLPESQLIIEGESNLNTFRYRFTDLPTGSSDAALGDFPAVLAKLLRDSLALELASFDSGHKRMNRDLLALLEADEHPAILISMKTLAGLDADGWPTGIASDNVAEIRAEAFFTIAGERRLHEFSVKVERRGTKLSLSGELQFDIGKFGLEAPTALFGLIKVREHIKVIFDIVLD